LDWAAIEASALTKVRESAREVSQFATSRDNSLAFKIFATHASPARCNDGTAVAHGLLKHLPSDAPPRRTEEKQQHPMPKYRHSLPQTRGELFVTDGGLETTLVFHDQRDLPAFAAFPLLDHAPGRERLADYYRSYLEHAAEHGVGFILESATWRANPDWAHQLGYTAARLAALNRLGVSELVKLRAEYAGRIPAIVISGCIGPRGDGYIAENLMSAAESEAYHNEQIFVFSETEADMISAFTLNYAEEAIGIARAARRHGMPVAISFTVETDGRLPSGQSLRDAIAQVDFATGNSPAYYMINCAHPSHFAELFEKNEPWLRRIRGIRANASRVHHARRRQSGRARRRDSAAPQPALDAHGPRRLLRHRRSPHRRDLRRLRRPARRRVKPSQTQSHKHVRPAGFPRRPHLFPQQRNNHLGRSGVLPLRRSRFHFHDDLPRD
jgi:homocysteine S-methyltransferase